MIIKAISFINHSTFKQKNNQTREIVNCMGGGHKKTPEFIYKSLCVYPYMFKLQSPSKYSPFDSVHLSRFFSHCSKQFLNSSILMPFSASAGFVHLFHFEKTFPFEGTFHSGKQTKKVSRIKIRWIIEVGHGVILFLVKNWRTVSLVWVGVLINHPLWNEQICWKSLPKNSLKPNSMAAGTLIQRSS